MEEHRLHRQRGQQNEIPGQPVQNGVVAVRDAEDEELEDQHHQRHQVIVQLPGQKAPDGMGRYRQRGKGVGRRGEVSGGRHLVPLQPFQPGKGIQVVVIAAALPQGMADLPGLSQRVLVTFQRAELVVQSLVQRETALLDETDGVHLQMEFA